MASDPNKLLFELFCNTKVTISVIFFTFYFHTKTLKKLCLDTTYVLAKKVVSSVSIQFILANMSNVTTAFVMTSHHTVRRLSSEIINVKLQPLQTAVINGNLHQNCERRSNTSVM
ncbi:CLUMA_CG007492, isoform A [Clunio marinus]|uniref:CLUMA_CG007492, isoform A n=1 Tax=Clunio marinus TaxID=568069 RepID=A0A1J1I4Y6_9DIPT|nr:CLUMA_CG007492, isoform A [Clunio marinus]